MAKVIALTTDQKSQLATLTAAAKTANEAAGAANKAYREKIAEITGTQFGPLNRVVITDDGNTLVLL